MDNQTPVVSEEKINEAKRLLSQAAFENPANRLSCEAIIQSKSEAAIAELISTLQELLSEKEAAYQEYKQKIAEIAKEMLPPKPQTPPPTI